MAPGLCIGEGNIAMAQATRGSAPDIAGRGIADPYAMIESTRMMFEWLGHNRGIKPAVDAAASMKRGFERARRSRDPHQGHPRHRRHARHDARHRRGERGGEMRWVRTGSR